VIGLGQYLAFLGVSLLVICTPGQDTALTIRNTLLGDRRTGSATALGVSAGQATWTMATSAGLAAVLMASAPLFLAIRLAGAAYLVYLGLRSLLTAVSLPRSPGSPAQARGRDPASPPHRVGRSAPKGAGWGRGPVGWGLRRRDLHGMESASPGPHISTRAAFVQGFLSNLSNAKMVAFFISLLPPFAGPHPNFLLLLALGFNFCILTLAWLVAYSLAVERMGGWLRRSAIRRALDGILGGVLVALGLKVSTEALAA